MTAFAYNHTEWFRKLNSATKYPSIETYHVLGERGALTEELGPFAGIEPDEDVILTEKVDGTNIRIVLMPNHDWFVGVREELVYAKGDRIVPSVMESAVREVLTYAERAEQWQRGQGKAPFIQVLYMEVYGSKIGGAAKNYTKGTERGVRLFDVAYIESEVLDEPLEKIASWRDHGGQSFSREAVVLRAAEVLELPHTPRLGAVKAEALPTTLEGMQEWLRAALPGTQVALSDNALRNAEGMVLRTKDRSRIAKARFADYARTLEPQPQRKAKVTS